MRLIIIFLLFSFSIFGQSGIEPSSFQGTPYEGGILKGVVPIVDEFTGETVYLYQHSEDCCIAIDSLVFTDSLRLYTSEGVFTTYIASGGGGSGTVTSIATTLPITGGTITTTGTIGINTANGSQSGAISSTDWTTFNNKFNLPSLTSGSVLFSDGTTIAEDNTKLFWNNSTKRLSIGSNLPVTTLDILGRVQLQNTYANIFMGNLTGNDTGTGGSNTGIGALNLRSLTTGTYNTAIGNNILDFTTIGGSNLGFGNSALYTLTTGNSNIGIGTQSLYSNNGEENVAIGRRSGYLNTGNFNTAIGTESLRSSSGGSQNTSIGYGSGYSNTGSNNVFLGFQSGFSETGSDNLYISNSTTTTPLIGGKFTTNKVGINKAISSLSTTLHIGGDLTIDTRTGTATSVAGFDTNGKVVTLGLGAGLSITGGDLISTATGITSLGGETGATQTFATGTTGTDFNISSASNVHTFNLPTASSVNTGKLSAADWITFNNKGNGTVTNFSAGDLSPLFITTEATTTTTPALSFLPVSQTANLFYASPNGSSGNPTFRSIVAADVPTLNQNTTGSAATLTTGRTISMTGDLSYTSGSFNGSANVTGTGTLATVNSNVGTFTNATVTVNAKGLITAASSGSGSGITSLGGQTGATQTFATANTGTYPSWSSASNVHTYRLPSASTGQVLKYDGTGWAAGTDNSGITGGNTNRIPYWTSSTAQSFTNFTWEAGLPGMQVPTGNSIWFSGTATIIDKNNDGGVADQVLTRAASGGGMDWRSIADLGAGGTNLSYSVKSGTDVTLESSTGVDVIIRDGVGTNVNRIASNVIAYDALGAQFAQLYRNGTTNLGSAGSVTLYTGYVDALTDGSSAFTTNTGTGRIDINFNGYVRITISGEFTTANADADQVTLNVYKNGSLAASYGYIGGKNFAANDYMSSGVSGMIVEVTDTDYFDTRYVSDVTNATVVNPLFNIQRIK